MIKHGGGLGCHFNVGAKEPGGSGQLLRVASVEQQRLTPAYGPLRFGCGVFGLPRFLRFVTCVPVHPGNDGDLGADHTRRV